MEIDIKLLNLSDRLCSFIACKKKNTSRYFDKDIIIL